MPLKGEDKGIQNENMRELKNKGLSERDAVLVSMKNSKKKDKKKSDMACCEPVDEAYPYGLRIDLDNDSLDKLSIDELPEAGETMKLVAEVKVESVSDRQDRSGDRNRSVGLQITKMKLA